MRVAELHAAGDDATVVARRRYDLRTSSVEDD
jgi:hypothetical protein